MFAPRDLGKQRKKTKNACDACRARKVKCNYNGGSVCVFCSDSQIACTQDRPRKRRGPTSRYVESIKQQEQEAPDSSRVAASSSQTSPAFLATPPGPGTLDDLAPFPVIQKVVNDWFEFVHPVCPILHHDGFLRQLNDQTACHEATFIDLVISVCAATAATLRRKISTYGNITAESCYDLFKRRQQNSTSMKISLGWCQIRYNFAVSLSPSLGIDDPLSQMLQAEATAGIGYLLHYAIDTMSFLEQELVKRLHWLCFAANCTMGLHGRPFFAMLNSNNTEAPRPVEVADAAFETNSTSDQTWHGNKTSYIPGLNALSDLFSLWSKSQQRGFRDLTRLRESMDLVLCSLDDVPPELRWRGGLSRSVRSNFGTDVQMVNLYITQIHIRSVLLEHMDQIAGADNDESTLAEISIARHTLIDDMLAIVYQMPEDTLEANGWSLVPKLRNIGLPLLNEIAESGKALAKLQKLLAKLERLDVRPASQHDPTSPVSVLTTQSSAY